MKYQNRERAEGFGLFARQYDKTRPSYSKGLIEWLSVNEIGNAIDVGCGTGQVATLLSKAGWKVIAIEPDERMAKIARSHHVKVIVSKFEQWTPKNKDFDLITAGTSWHWIDPKVGYDKAASILKPGGRLAIFRNFYNYEAKVTTIIAHTLKQFAPKLLKECVPLGIGDQNQTDSHVNQVENRKDLFARYEIRVFQHDRVVPIDIWIEELTTHSPIYLLEKSISNKLLTELAEKVESVVGDNIKITHDTYCLLVWKH